VDEEALSESGSIFKFGPPDDDAKHGRLRNPTGHGGVYKVDGHGRPEPSVGEENSTFLPSHGGRSPAHPSIFFPLGLGQEDFIVSRQNIFEMEKILA
jgi:hypothetical protein